MLFKVTRNVEIFTSITHTLSKVSGCPYFNTIHLLIKQRQIICLFFGKGAQHDFKLFKISQIQIHPETESIQDSAYQGIKGYHFNSYIPRKKPKNGELTQLERDYNRVVSQERIGIEHINRRFKIFRILAGKYRNRRHRYNLRCNLIAAIHNYEISLAS